MKSSFYFTVALLFSISSNLKCISIEYLGVADLLAAFFLSVDKSAFCASLFEMDLFGVLYLP